MRPVPAVTDQAPRLAPRPVAIDPPAEESRWTRVDGQSVHARSWVGARVPATLPVVCVHGLGVASRMCQPLAGHLAPRNHTYAPDLPGFGESDKPDATYDIPQLADALGGWMRASGLSKAVLVGTSVGAQVAAEAARLHPSACELLVLASPTVDRTRRRWREQLWRWQLEQATHSLRMRAIQMSDYARCGVGRVVRTFAAAMEHRLEDVLPHLPQPILLCWGTRDPLLSRQWVEDLASGSAARLVVLPRAVHAMSHESPLELARVVTHFIDEQATAP